MKLAIILLLCSLTGFCLAIPDYASTIRPPAFPLAVRNPYTNFWLSRNTLPGGWPNFWTGRTKGWTGLVRVDGETYVWMGNPLENGQSMGIIAQQTSSHITPTQTIFGITAGKVDLTVNFFSPVEYENIRKQSIPLSYVTVTAESNDGLPHNVQMYMDISGEWATSDLGQVIRWDIAETTNGLKVWTTELVTQSQFNEFEEYPRWGKAVLAASGSSSFASGSDLEVRNLFKFFGALTNSSDPNFRCASCEWPTFGFASSLGQLTTPQSVQYTVGLVRDNTANYMGTPQPGLWLSYWPTLGQMVDFFWGDLPQALATAEALDIKVLDDAYNAGGQYYADILALSLRQAYAGNEFTGNASDPIYYQKEISSGAFMQTVDVIYPAAPMFYYLNVHYLKLLLDPLFLQMETGIWTQPFAMHDIGDLYPNALGQGYGGDMPVEESANMIMMVGDICFHPQANEQESRAYAQLHYPVMSMWADYLYHNCLYPVDQLTTDDFIGPTELNSGLALKGILGMATFAKISELVGNQSAVDFYNGAVQAFLPVWLNESMHNDGTHLKMEYNVTDGYQFKYNALHDKILGLGVVSQEVYRMEAAYYLEKLEPYGIPFVSTHDYTKSDWEMWTAAAFGDVNPMLKARLIEGLGKFLTVTAQRVPFTDWYVTATANQVGFQSRPVAGGHFALLALNVK